MLTNYTIGDNRHGREFDRYMLDRTTIKLVSRDTRSAVGRLVVVLAGLLVEGGSLLDGAEAGDAEGLTGLGDGGGPPLNVLERALAVGVLRAADDLAVLVLHVGVLGEAGHGLLAGAVPDLSLGSADTNATGHVGCLEFVGYLKNRN